SRYRLTTATPATTPESPASAPKVGGWRWVWFVTEPCSYAVSPAVNTVPLMLSSSRAQCHLHPPGLRRPQGSREPAVAASPTASATDRPVVEQELRPARE